MEGSDQTISFYFSSYRVCLSATDETMGGENESQASYSFCGSALMSLRLRRPDGRRGARRVGQQWPQFHILFLIVMFVCG